MVGEVSKGGYKKHLFIVAVCLAAAVIACLVAWTNPLAIKRLDMMTFDYLQGQIKPPPPAQKIIAVMASEDSIQALHQWPWPRGVHAALLPRLRLADIVAIDITMSETSEPHEDAKYVNAIEKAGNVVQAMHHVPMVDGGDHLVLPFPALAAKVAAAGITNLPDEPNGIYRDAYLYWKIDGELVPSFPLAVWIASGTKPPNITERHDHFVADLPSGAAVLNKNLSFKIHHPESEIPIYEYIDVYNGNHPEETFRDAIVFVGVNAIGAADHYPIGRSRVLPGTIYNAHTLLTLMHGWIPFETPRWVIVATAGLLAAVGAGIGWARSVRRGWTLAAMVALLWLGISVVSFFYGRTWLPPTLPLGCLLAAFFTASVIQLRALSGEWKVSHLSIESLSALGDGEDIREDVLFSDYLASQWKPVEQWTGIRLLEPSAGKDNREVRFILKEAKGAANAAGSVGKQGTIISSRHGTRMLLRLPDTRTGEARFAVLGWKGRKSAETIKSVSVLVRSSAMHFKAVEEGRARRKLFFDVIRLIVGAVDAKDPTTAGHSERVADLARQLATDEGLPPHDVDEVYFAGLLHDVGKIGIPDSILNFPGRLSDADMEIMRRHPEIGASIMDKIELSPAVRSGILEHHERPDGKGYPHKITEGQLSLSGKILRIADVYDALVSKRQYKNPLPKDTVYKIMTDGAGKEFDPELLSVFLKRYFSEYPKMPDLANQQESVKHVSHETCAGV